ncbi:hypothetical protein B5F40_04655 [Gordonibacter sp. An230]|uniref:hypothetical protein n=1 Tax=Gordonibacter sp. An230 TaxID=1965592 RepID=UPI000B36793C|nr:hypothetical protein [Gordonibacter sp. An230]OUO91080.1 hypothetical protein B5F40_04655 [Gordonibacter sp. An230]
MLAKDDFTGEIGGFELSIPAGGSDLLFRPSAVAAPPRPLAPSPLFYEFGNLSDDDEVVAFAAVHGPLFGTRGWVPEDGAIRESVEDWKEAASALNHVLRLKAFCDGKAGVGDVSDFMHVVVAMGARGFSLTASCSLFSGRSEGAYRDLVRSSHVGESYQGAGGERVVAGLSVDPLGAHVAATYETFDYYPASPQSGQDRSFIDALASEGFPGDMAEECAHAVVRLCTMAHTSDVRFGFVDGVYGPVVECLLAGIWHEFGQAYSHEAIGVCKECGRVMDCTNERGKQKDYCSKACRDRARNKRNAPKMKLRRRMAAGMTVEEAARDSGVPIDEAKRLVGVE